MVSAGGGNFQRSRLPLLSISRPDQNVVQPWGILELRPIPDRLFGVSYSPLHDVWQRAFPIPARPMGPVPGLAPGLPVPVLMASLAPSY